MISLKKKLGGFTIIEVMIVLAIAGLIMLIVFLALPALQRNSRNYDRKQVAGELATVMEEYKNTHAGYPRTEAQICDFLKNYAGSTVGKRSGGCVASFSGPGDCITVKYSRYNICYHDSAHAPHTYIGPDNEVSIILSHWCNSGSGYWAGDGTNPITSGGAAIDNQYSRYVIWIAQENAPLVCIDNYANHL